MEMDVRCAELPPVPKVDKNWIKRPWYEEMEWWLGRGYNVLLVGQAGSGKTTGARQLAAETGKRFIRYSFENNTHIRQIFGQTQIVVSGGAPRTVFYESQLVAICRNAEGGIILLDEVNMLDPQKAATLHELLDNRTVFIKEARGGRGEILEIPESVMFVLACNPPKGAYIGTQRMNAALVDRTVTILVPAFDKAHLKKILGGLGGLDAGQTEHIIKCYMEMDKLIMGQGLKVQSSIRALQRMREAVLGGKTVGDAACQALIRHAEACGDIAGAQALRSLIMTILPAAQQPDDNEIAGIAREAEG
jgi:MoxR-like ATPase